MLKPRGEDLETVKRWRRVGLLVEVDNEKLKRICDKGLILVGCGDGDQIPDFLRHLVQRVKCAKRPHLHLENGNPLSLVKEAPIPKEMRFHDQLKARIKQSRRLKRISTLLLCCHYPCGMAWESHISLPMIICYTYQAAQEMVKDGWDAKKIVLLFHCDYGDGKRRTYFIEKEKINQL